MSSRDATADSAHADASEGFAPVGEHIGPTCERADERGLRAFRAAGRHADSGAHATVGPVTEFLAPVGAGAWVEGKGRLEPMFLFRRACSAERLHVSQAPRDASLAGRGAAW